MAPTYKIAVKCPVTGRMIDSGIRTSGREAVNSGLFHDGKVSCPHCHQIHSFENNSFLDVDLAVPAIGPWRPNAR